MSKTQGGSAVSKGVWSGLSLDSWSVVLALGLALLVWAGWIKRIPW